MSTRKNFPLRLSHSLYEQLQRMAEQELRSVNGQIEFLLTQAVRKHGRTASTQSPAQTDSQPPIDPPDPKPTGE